MPRSPTAFASSIASIWSSRRGMTDGPLWQWRSNAPLSSASTWSARALSAPGLRVATSSIDRLLLTLFVCERGTLFAIAIHLKNRDADCQPIAPANSLTANRPSMGKPHRASTPALERRHATHELGPGGPSVVGRPGRRRRQFARDRQQAGGARVLPEGAQPEGFRGRRSLSRAALHPAQSRR